MSLKNIQYEKTENRWITEPIIGGGGDIRVRVHKTGPVPVEVLVSIDGEEEYIFHDDFGADEKKCEVTMIGVMKGQCMKLQSRSEFTLVKVMES